MPFDVDGLDFRPGDPIRAADMQALRDELRRPSAGVRGGPGLSVRRGARGEAHLAAPGRLAFVGTASGAISARSGTAWGTGSVAMLGWDGTAEDAIGTTYDVVNPGPAIASGDHVRVEEDFQGNLIVSPLAQPNHAWCQLGSSLGPATGTWPSLTPTTASVAAYRKSGGSLASIGTVTAYNWRNVTWAAGKTMLLLDNGDGTFDVDDEDC